MAQQYYTLEEAARVLGMQTAQLNELREKGDLRAFADRGKWKFRVKEVDELARQRGDAARASEKTDDEEQVLLVEGELGPSDSGAPSTVIGMEDAPSDSDVHLVTDANAASVSDSDVQLFFDDQPQTDSDVHLGDDPSGSRTKGSKDRELLDPLAASPDAKAKSKGNVPWDSDLVLGTVSDSEIGISKSDSGISLEKPADSGISLEQPPDLVPADAASGDELLETDFEVPVLDDSGSSGTEADLEVDSDFELAPGEDAFTDSATQVIAVKGDEDVDASAATTLAQPSSALIDDAEDSAVVEAVEEAGGELSAEIPVTRGALLRAQETEWGMWTVVGLSVTCVIALLATFMMFDLVRNLWTPNQPNQINGLIMDLFTRLDHASAFRSYFG